MASREKERDLGGTQPPMNPLRWRRTKLGAFLRHLPRIKHVRGTWLHRQLGDRLFDNELWHPTRQSFAAGCSVGIFFGMVPIPGQMLMAALMAYVTRVNIPIAVASTWFTNPVTMPFFLYGQYRLGCFVLGWHSPDPQNWNVWELISRAPLPIYMGAFLMGAMTSLIAYPICLVGWDKITKRFFLARPRPRIDVRED